MLVAQTLRHHKRVFALRCSRCDPSNSLGATNVALFHRVAVRVGRVLGISGTVSGTKIMSTYHSFGHDVAGVPGFVRFGTHIRL